MITCNQARDRLGELLDGELPPPLRDEVERHVEGCPACRRELQALRALAAALRPAPKASLPPGLWAAIERRLEAPPQAGGASRAARMTPTPRAARLRLVRWRPLAAAAVLVLAVGAAWLWNKPLEPAAVAAQIDFRPLLEQAEGNIEAGVQALLRAHGGEPITPQEAARQMTMRVHVPAKLPGELRWKSMHVLNMGEHHRSLAFYLDGPRGQLLLLQCPAGTRKEYGNRECIACQVGGQEGHVVRAGPLRLMHFESPNVCVCVVSTLEETVLTRALDAIRIDY